MNEDFHIAQYLCRSILSYWKRCDVERKIAMLHIDIPPLFFFFFFLTFAAATTSGRFW
jgi:hypothetical protein